MKIFNKKHTDLLYFFLFGFVIFSPFCTVLLMDFLHFPFFLPELLVIPFCFLLKKYIRTIRISELNVLSAGMIVLLLLIFGILYEQFPISEMLSTCRSWFYLLIFYFAFRKDNAITNEQLLYLSIGALISWLIVARFNFNTILRNSISNQGEMCIYGAMLLVPLFISLTMSMKRYKILIMGLLIILPICVFSGVRRLIVVTALSIFISYLMIMKKNKQSFLLYTIIGCLFLGLGALILPSFMDLVEESSPEMYYRIFGRTISFLETGDSQSEGDITRIRNILSFLETWTDYIIPRGMVSLRTGTDASIGLFNDFPLYQLCWLFGIPFFILIFFHFIGIICRNLKKYIKTLDDTSCFSVCCLSIMFCMLFLDGTFIGFAEYTPITGMLLGIAEKNSKRI